MRDLTLIAAVVAGLAGAVVGTASAQPISPIDSARLRVQVTTEAYQQALAAHHRAEADAWLRERDAARAALRQAEERGKRADTPDREQPAPPASALQARR